MNDNKQTKTWKMNESTNLIADKQIIEAADMIKKGGLVAFPTETVYGLGADATNEAAVRKIFTAKGRPSDNPLIAHFGDRETVAQFVDDIPQKARQLMDAFWPGPLTIILPSKGKLAQNVTAGLETVGVRIPDHPIALALLKNVGKPVAAPSANQSGKPSPTLAEHVSYDLNGKVDGIIDGGKVGVGVESTVIDCTVDVPVILRPGGVTRKQIEAVIGPVHVATGAAETDTPRSPGMKYKHYAPSIPIWLITGPSDVMEKKAKELRDQGKKVSYLVSAERAAELKLLDDVIILGSRENLSNIANHLYESLRKIDQLNTDLVLAESFPNQGIGEALMNRLERAATVIL